MSWSFTVHSLVIHGQDRTNSILVFMWDSYYVFECVEVLRPEENFLILRLSAHKTVQNSTKIIKTDQRFHSLNWRNFECYLQKVAKRHFFISSYTVSTINKGICKIKNKLLIGF